MTVSLLVNTVDEKSNQPGVAGQLFYKISTQINYAVVLWIVSVPEGLPLAIGVSLAFSVMKMYGDNIIVMRPETLGIIDEICCGKTGTITTGNMRVEKFHVANEFNKENKEGSDQEFDVKSAKKNSRKNTIFNCQLTDECLTLI